MATLEGLSPVDQMRRFWRWWTGELALCIPAAFRNWVRRLSVLPMVVADKGGFGVYRYNGKTWTRIATAQGDNAESLAKALAVELRNTRVDRFAVGLPAGQHLSKTLTIPQAAEDNLRNALLYELDRHTPFRADEVGFDFAVIGRNELTRELIVRLVIAPKTTIANAISTAAATGLTVASVQPALPDRDSLAINLLPHDDSSNLVRTLLRWIPWLILVALGAVAISLPLLQKRAQVIELQPQVNIAAQQAAAADVLNRQLDRAQGEYNFLLHKRYAMPTALQLLGEATHILPDDTWLQSFELRTTQKGRELQLQGETGVAGKMIELFEQSQLVTGASFKSPVTQAPGSTASRFHIGMDVKEVPPPAIRKPDGSQIAGTPPGAPAPAVPGVPGAPGAAGAAPAPGGSPLPAAGAPLSGPAAAGPGSPPPAGAVKGGPPLPPPPSGPGFVAGKTGPGAPASPPPAPAPGQTKAAPGAPSPATPPALNPAPPAPSKSGAAPAAMSSDAAAFPSIPNAVRVPSSGGAVAQPPGPVSPPTRPGINSSK